MNACVERFVQSIEQECLDKFVAFGQEHLDYLSSRCLGHLAQALVCDVQRVQAIALTLRAMQADGNSRRDRVYSSSPPT